MRIWVINHTFKTTSYGFSRLGVLILYIAYIYSQVCGSDWSHCLFLHAASEEKIIEILFIVVWCLYDLAVSSMALNTSNRFLSEDFSTCCFYLVKNHEQNSQCHENHLATFYLFIFFMTPLLNNNTVYFRCRVILSFFLRGLNRTD